MGSMAIGRFLLTREFHSLAMCLSGLQSDRSFHQCLGDNNQRALTQTLARLTETPVEIRFPFEGCLGWNRGLNGSKNGL